MPLLYPPLYPLAPSGGGGDTTPPSPAPTAHINAYTLTSFTLFVDAVSGEAGTILRAQYRQQGSAAAWTTGASDSSPAVGDTLAVTGLTSGYSLEWRIIEEDGSGNVADGTHGTLTLADEEDPAPEPAVGPWWENDLDYMDGVEAAVYHAVDEGSVNEGGTVETTETTIDLPTVIWQQIGNHETFMSSSGDRVADRKAQVPTRDLIVDGVFRVPSIRDYIVKADGTEHVVLYYDTSTLDSRCRIYTRKR